MRRDESVDTGDENRADDDDISGRFFKHIGVYSYTREFLFTYTNLPKSTLETEEKLEQLRVLEHGYNIKTIETRYETIGVDTPEDLEKVKLLLARSAGEAA